MSERTPSQIVQAADEPATALAAFVAQELEAWGFNIGITADPAQLRILPPGREMGTTLTIKVEV